MRSYVDLDHTGVGGPFRQDRHSIWGSLGPQTSECAVLPRAVSRASQRLLESWLLQGPATPSWKSGPPSSASSFSDGRFWLHALPLVISPLRTKAGLSHPVLCHPPGPTPDICEWIVNIP